MARSCGEPEEALEEEEENSDEEGDDDGELSFEEKETEKQHLLYCQERSVFITDKGFNQSGHGVDELPVFFIFQLENILRSYLNFSTSYGRLPDLKSLLGSLLMRFL